MNTVNRELSRIILRTLVEYARAYPGDLHHQTGRLLHDLSAMEIEKIVEACKRHISIDFVSVGKEILRHRNERLLSELVHAGATNGLLREVFGVTPRQLTRLRGNGGKPPAVRRRLTDNETGLVLEFTSGIPLEDGSQLATIVLCLDIVREHDLPFMPVYRCVTENPDRNHDQE